MRRLSDEHGDGGSEGEGRGGHSRLTVPPARSLEFSVIRGSRCSLAAVMVDKAIERWPCLCRVSFSLCLNWTANFGGEGGALKEQMDGYTQYDYKRHLFRDNRQLSIFVNFCRKEQDLAEILLK